MDEQPGLLAHFMDGLMAGISPQAYAYKQKKREAELESTAKQAQLEALSQTADQFYQPLYDVASPKERASIQAEWTLAKSRNAILADMFPDMFKNQLTYQHKKIEPTANMKDVGFIGENDPAYADPVAQAQLLRDIRLKPSTQINLGDKPITGGKLMTEDGTPVYQQPNESREQMEARIGQPVFVDTRPTPEKPPKLNSIPQKVHAGYLENKVTRERLVKLKTDLENGKNAVGIQNQINNIPGGKYALPYVDKFLGATDEEQKKYQDLRTRLGDVRSYKKHDIYGSAVSAGESRDAAWSIVDPTDDANVNISKLDTMINKLDEENSAMEQYYTPDNNFQPIGKIGINKPVEAKGTGNAKGIAQKDINEMFPQRIGMYRYNDDQAFRYNIQNNSIEMKSKNGWKDAKVNVNDKGEFALGDPDNEDLNEQQKDVPFKRMRQKSTGKIVRVYEDGRKEYE